MKKKSPNKAGGYVVMVITIIFATIALILVVGGAVPIISHYSAVRGNAYSKQAFLTASSATDEALYRLWTGKNLPASVTLNLLGSTANINTSVTPTGKRVSVSSSQTNYIRSYRTDLQYGDGISFFYGIQAGQGGFELLNSSSIIGNVYSGGQITGVGNFIRGDVVSSGPSGLIDGIHATGTAYAHTINNSTVDKDAYYMVKTGTTVTGTSYPNSPDQSDAELPISDEQIEEWEAGAALGGMATCTNGKWIISTTVTVGPKEVPCNLIIKNSAVVTITGHIWVTGNIDMSNSSIVKMDPSLGSQNVAIIADNPSDTLTSGRISVDNSVAFQNSGFAGSFIFLISQNNSAETGGNLSAIDIANSANAAVAYASHGMIPLANDASLKEVTAYKIRLKNSAIVTYDSGLASSLFKSGPGGGYNIIDWYEQ